VDFWVSHSLKNIHASLLKGSVLLVIIAAFIVNYIGVNALTAIVVLCTQLLLCLLISKPYQRLFARSAHV